MVTSHIIYNILYFQSKMQILEENMKENNILPAHYPPLLNIHTVNDAKLHIQAQRGATSSNILRFAVPGWAEVACFQFSLGLIVKSRVWGGCCRFGGTQHVLCSHKATRTFHQFNVVCSQIGMNLRGPCDVIKRMVFLKMLTHTATCFPSCYTQ